MAKQVPQGEEQDPQVSPARLPPSRPAAKSWHCQNAGMPSACNRLPSYHRFLSPPLLAHPIAPGRILSVRAPCAATSPLQVAEAVREMVSGVRRYFDRGLRHFLLYSHEVAQAEEAGILGEGAGGGSSSGAPGATEPPKLGA